MNKFMGTAYYLSSLVSASLLILKLEQLLKNFNKTYKLKRNQKDN